MTQPADLIITNARVYTVDPANLHAAAPLCSPPAPGVGEGWGGTVAVRGNRIVWVGRADDVRDWRGARTQVIDAGGRTLLPGLIDCHFHLLSGSLRLDHLHLDAARDPERFAALLRDHAASHPDDEWIEGVQVLYATFPRDRPLDRHFLDAIVPDRPVYLTAYDGHTVWVNTEALRRAGLLQGRDLPAGHQIVMDPTTGLATGELREPEAFKPVRDLIPKPDSVRKRAMVRRGMAWLASLGLTSVQNMDSWDHSIEVYKALQDLGELTLRIYVPFNMQPEMPLEALQEAAEWPEKYNDSHLRTGAIKLFMDGVLESTTALMVDDYANAPGNRGSALYTAGHFNAIAAEADRLGLQIAVHACGDGAVRRALDGYAYARKKNGQRDSRHRVEHVEVIHPDDIPRFAQLGVIASMQPPHCPPDILDTDVWPARAGEARWPYSFAWRTLRKAGAHLAFGSDWPVASPDPLLGFYAALNREPWLAPPPASPTVGNESRVGGEWGGVAQAQTLEETIAGYTRDAAYAEFQEHEKGMIRTGMLADLVLMSADIFAVPKEEILSVRPVLTVCDGKVVYQAV